MKKQVLVILIVLLAGFVASIGFNIFQYVQYQIPISGGTVAQAAVFFNEFGAIPTTDVNSSFIPPISMYHALQIGLESGGWNKTSLKGMIVNICLMHGETLTNDTAPWTNIEGEVTNPPASYSDYYSNNVIYRYVWEITVDPAKGLDIPPPGFILIDASTGIILPNPILL